MTSTPNETYSKPRWIILLLCVSAMILSAWLTYQKLTGKIDSLAGCGKGSDCSNILGSKWSVIFGSIPVSLPSFFLYLALAVSLGRKSVLVRIFHLIAAWTLLAAAAWFIGLQMFKFSGFCKYCMATHSIGILVALGLMLNLARGHAREHLLALPVGVIAVLMLALTQIFGPVPASHRVDSISGADTHGKIHSLGEGRLVHFLGGNKSYRVDALPHLGKSDAKNVLVKYFDYTCYSCGKVDGYLEATLEQYPKDVVVILLPVPLNRACNAHLPAEVKDHTKACEFARYALAVWRAAPDEFSGYHHWLFKNSNGTIKAAEQEAVSRVGEQAFQRALADDWGNHVIRQNCKDYRILIQRTSVMPKLLIGGSRVLQGASSSAGSFVHELKKHLPLGE